LSQAPEEALFKSSLSVEEKVAIAMSVGEEIVSPEELTALYTARDHPIVYDGFEPSGRMHIAQGVLRAINVNKLTSTGCLFKFWVADWFAQLNNKMDGDLAKIKTVGLYMIEIWKAIGMNMQNVRFLWASDEINAHADEYWTLVMDIARLNNLKRIQRCCTIMGRKEEDEMSAAQIFYPCMQCADVFFLKADICQLGMDQRKVNMLARYAVHLFS
jgi:tyrosyl-tRNA synthetase